MITFNEYFIQKFEEYNNILTCNSLLNARNLCIIIQTEAEYNKLKEIADDQVFVLYYSNSIGFQMNFAPIYFNKVEKKFYITNDIGGIYQPVIVPFCYFYGYIYGNYQKEMEKRKIEIDESI